MSNRFTTKRLNDLWFRIQLFDLLEGEILQVQFFYLLCSTPVYYLSYWLCVLYGTTVDLHHTHTIVGGKLKIDVWIVFHTFLAFIYTHLLSFWNSFENFRGLQMQHDPKDRHNDSLISCDGRRRLEGLSFFFEGVSIGEKVDMFDLLA